MNSAAAAGEALPAFPIHIAGPGSPTQERLALLASRAATSQPDRTDADRAETTKETT